MEQKLAFRLGDAVISEGRACISGSRLRCRSLHKGSLANRRCAWHYCQSGLVGIRTEKVSSNPHYSHEGFGHGGCRVQVLRPSRRLSIAGPYCSTGIADLMAKALNPFSTAASGRRGKLELPQRGLPSTGPVPVMKGPVDI